MFADLLDATLRRNDKWHSHRTHKNKRWKGQEVPILGVMRHGWVKKRFEESCSLVTPWWSRRKICIIILHRGVA